MSLTQIYLKQCSGHCVYLIKKTSANDISGLFVVDLDFSENQF